MAVNYKYYVDNILGNKKKYEDLNKKINIQPNTGGIKRGTNYANGLVAISPYLQNKAKTDGLSENEIKNMITYDDTTGNVSFFGHNIGKPDILGQNGVSYWTPEYLDSVWDNRKNITERNKIADETKAYYDGLMDIGESTIANNLKNRDYQGAKTYADNVYSKLGKVPVRSTAMNYANLYNFTPEQLDNMIRYDDETGEVTVGNTNLGKLSVVDDVNGNGTSYIDKPEAVQNAVKEYANSTGATIGYDTLGKMKSQNEYDQEQEAFRKNNELTDITSGYIDKGLFGVNGSQELFDRIMGGFGVDAKDAYDNTVATDASTNSGNLDSFGRADATRQKNAILEQGARAGAEAVLNYFNSIVNGSMANNTNYVDNAAKLISALQNGRQIDENALNAETDRQVKSNDDRRADEALAGYMGQEWNYKNNPYLNSDGSVKSAYMADNFNNNGGFDTLISERIEQWKSEPEGAYKDSLYRDIQNMVQARMNKFNDPKYAQYADNKYAEFLPANVRTLEGTQVDNARDISMEGYNNERYKTDETLKTEKEIADAENKNALDQIKETGNQTRANAEKEAELNGGTSGNGMQRGQIEQSDINRINAYKSSGDGEVPESVKNEMIKKYSQYSNGSDLIKQLALDSTVPTQIVNSSESANSQTTKPVGSLRVQDQFKSNKNPGRNPYLTYPQLGDNEKVELIKYYSQFSNAKELLQELGITEDDIARLA